ncbi:esterase lipase [Lecanosticta acicola]|uniref:Carboxylic ester hydrolase n=1 Tax=Lecanosticta acicola TaxID=111012 RepID=A0AAI8W1D3_9PEZI|nr:esterase lipase [Lecanosticta acicola]
MPREEFQQSSYQLDAGSLGYLEGLTLTSTSSPRSYHYFGGVPYALPPVGPYRFRQARALPSLYRYGSKANPGRYTARASVCPQPGFRTEPDESLWDEDCLQLNIYIPGGTAPVGGWPVFVYIHGGFLQWGSPNFEVTSLSDFMTNSAFKAIMVTPAYRVNALGYLASRELQAEALLRGEPTGNQGFWDQRLALEWTGENIGAFGGDSKNITIGGYSAGSHSVFQQLAHELYFVPAEKALIKRAIMWSNSPGVQPKTINEQQKQFDELLSASNIPLMASAGEKLEKLRAVSPRDLVAAQSKMKVHEFRAFSDGIFVDKDIIGKINSGDFARRMKSRGIKLMNGECRDEHNLYQAWRTPSPSYEAVYTRLCADYPETAVQKLMYLRCGEKRHLPKGCQDWQDAFGRLYADMQVHGLERGFHRALANGGLEPGKDLLRYRFNWRTEGSKLFLPPEWGVTHATDHDIWWYGIHGDGLTDEEKTILRPWNEKFAAFVHGQDPRWGTTDVREMLRLREDGTTDIWTDDRFDEGLEVWDTVNSQTASVLGWIRSML